MLKSSLAPCLVDILLGFLLERVDGDSPIACKRLSVALVYVADTEVVLLLHTPRVFIHLAGNLIFLLTMTIVGGLLMSPLPRCALLLMRLLSESSLVVLCRWWPHCPSLLLSSCHWPLKGRPALL